MIGIDLGTTSSEACYVDDKGNTHIIPASEGSFGGKNFPSVVAFTPKAILVGHQAKRYVGEKITEFKRYMGTDWRYFSKTLRAYFTPEQLSAFVLNKIKQDAEKFLGKRIEWAVITVPAYFNDNQRQATKDAARIAGLEVKRLINEPTAAAMAYGFKGHENVKVTVLDLGGGTFDVTVMEIAEGVFQVLSTSGDTKLGGCDMDNALYEYIVKEEGLSLDDRTAQILRSEIERAKMELSASDVTVLYVPGVIEREITRAEFEMVIEPVLKRLEKPIMQALNDADLTPDKIDKVLLVGGATKVPAVQRKFREIFGDKILGEAEGVDPMRAVAIGAGIQAAILDGRLKSEVLLIDVTPLSLGVKTKDGKFSRIIPRNTPIPVKKSRLYTTAYDNQTQVRIDIYQGEREIAEENIYLGTIYLNVLPAPAGVPKIEVIFEIDENGVLNVTALDKGTGKKETLRIEAPHRLSEEEIRRMIEEAEKYREMDKRRLEEIELKNKAIELIKSVNNLPDNYRKEVEDLAERVKSLIKGEVKLEELREGVRELEKKLHEIAKRIYR